MFSSALKSFTSNIAGNYSLSPQPVAYSGPWKIFDAKKKSTGQMVSVFSFEKKSLENPSGASLSLRSTSSAGIKQVQDEAYDRHKKAASSLARLRHPCVLELVEQVEETRSGLMFATEHVTGSLGGLLKEKDEQEGRGGARGNAIDDGRGGRRRREVEIDELEIQKGILQIAKGLEFLHESAGLIHGNLTPEAIFINAKGDWKISALSFSIQFNAAEGSSVSSSIIGDMLNYDPRLPSSAQLNLDFAAPELVIDSEASPAIDMFSLGLLIVSLYTFPHTSPLQTHNSVSTYRRLLSSPSSAPTHNNQFLSSRPLPKGLADMLLPRLLTRRPANRLSAREFQESPYFDNMLVSTIRFLDSFPAKTPGEKNNFLRGLVKVLNQFPRTVLEKKMLPTLVEELKDKEMLPLILPNIFGIVERTSGRVFSEKVLPKLKSTFFPHGHQPADAKNKTPSAAEKDQNLQSGLSVILDNMALIIDNTSAKEFKEDALPMIDLALESSNHSLQDKALRALPAVLPALDFPTLKNELFPVICTVFSKTTSLGIKIRGLEAFFVLLGGEAESSSGGLDGMPANAAKKQKGPTLDKYTVQEKLVPLLRAIKTKEPAVMMAALEVFKEVGKICDREIVATEVLPILWTMSLGPLLNLQQFQGFMTVIKSLSSRIEQEQTRKLQELSTPDTTAGTDFLSFGGIGNGGASGNEEIDFERLVLGKSADQAAQPFDGGWGSSSATPNRAVSPAVRAKPTVSQQPTATFSWSTPTSTAPTSRVQSTSPVVSRPMQPIQPTQTTPSLKTFAPLAPTNRPSSTPSAGFGSTSAFRQPQATTPTPNYAAAQTGIDWSSASKPTSSYSSISTLTPQPATRPQPTTSNSFSIPPPPSAPQQSGHPTILYGQTRMAKEPPQSHNWGAFSIPPPPSASTPAVRPTVQATAPNYGNISTAPVNSASFGVLQPQQPQQQQPQQKQTLEAWESLL